MKRCIGLMVKSVLFLSLLVIGLGAAHGTEAETQVCNGLLPTITGAGTITGTSGDDVIVGSAGDDVIDGGAGDDTICGEGGNDVISGGTGNDDLWGDSSRVLLSLSGVPGNDMLDGGSGSDRLNDRVGFGQVLNGGSGNDQIFGIGLLVGESGNDSLNGTSNPPGPQTFDGGAGRDTCNLSTRQDTLNSCETVGTLN